MATKKYSEKSEPKRKEMREMKMSPAAHKKMEKSERAPMPMKAPRGRGY